MILNTTLSWKKCTFKVGIHSSFYGQDSNLLLSQKMTREKLGLEVHLCRTQKKKKKFYLGFFNLSIPNRAMHTMNFT